MSPRMPVLALLLWIVAVPSLAGDGRTAREWNWSLSGFVGGTYGGPSQEMESAMKRWGFGVRSPDRDFGILGRDHPFTNEAGVSSWVLASRRFDGPYSVGVLYGHTEFGATHGFHTLAKHLVAGYDLDVFAVIVSLNDRSMLQSFLQEDIFELTLGVGPALFRTRSANHDIDSPEKSDATKFGLLFDAGLRAPANRRFFVGVDIQYRLTGSVAVGPYTATSDVFSTGETATLPETDVSFSHFVIGFGIGMRL